MKRNNSEILSKVKTIVSENKKESKTSKDKISKSELVINNEINKWIEINAEKIAKEIIEKEVKKIFK
ncbi:MAG: hypothetical protein VX976_03335 [Pseudomonadota bacterium]|nr:hypothetical protein [Pseudomonadota bacterium]